MDPKQNSSGRFFAVYRTARTFTRRVQKLFGAYDQRAVIGGVLAIGAVAALFVISSVFRERPRILLAPDDAVLSAPAHDQVFRSDEGISVELDLDKLGGEEVLRRAPMPQPVKKEAAPQTSPTSRAPSQNRSLSFFGFLGELIDATQHVLAQDPEPQIGELPPQAILPTGRNPIVAQVVGPNGRLTDIEPLFVTANNKVRVSIPEPQRHLRPGRYLLRIWTLKDRVIYYSESSFLWGVLVVNTTKSIYVLGDEARLGFGVLDDGGRTLCNADIVATVTAPSGMESVFRTADGSIAKSSVCGPDTVTDEPDYAAAMLTEESGIHEVIVTATTQNGVRKITDAFMVQERPEFDVERVGPTRIFPPSAYAMTLRVSAYAAWSGDIVETVPAEFVVPDMEDMKQEVHGGGRRLIWNVSLAAGEMREFTYTFDAPDISPELYKLGPLTLGTWKEYRQWQIASDAVITSGSFLMYGDVTVDDAPRYRSSLGATSTMGAETASIDATQASAEICHISMSAGPTRNEFIVGNQLTGGQLGVIRATNTVWSNLFAVNNIAADQATACGTVGVNGIYQAFDVAHEQLSGDGIVAYAKAASSGALFYVTWDGVATTTEQQFIFNAAAGVPRWVRLVSEGMKLTDNRSNRILALVSDANNDLFAMIWDGSQFVQTTTITTNGPSTNMRYFDGAIEALSGDIVVVYGSGTIAATTPFYYKRHTGGVWDASANAMPAVSSTIGGWVIMASDPLTNRISAGLNSAASVAAAINSQGWPAIWRSATSTATWTLGTGDTTLESLAAPQVQTEWLRFGSSTSYGISAALFTFSDQGTADVSDYRFWTPANFGASTDIGGAWTDDASWRKLISSPNANEMMYIGVDSDNDIRSQVWLGGSAWAELPSAEWDAGVATSTDTASSTQNNAFAFAYKPYSPWGLNWRWYDGDEQGDPPSSALAAQNTSATVSAASGKVRLRYNVAERGGSAQIDNRVILQWTTSTLPDASSTLWTDVGNVGSSTAWRYFDASSTVAGDDGAQLSTTLLSSSTHAGWWTLNWNGAASSSMDHASNTVRELEFAIEANNADSGLLYYFRMYNAFSTSTGSFKLGTPIYRLQTSNPATPCNPVQACSYPSILTEASTILTQNDFRWFANADTAQPGSALAIENATATVAATSTKIRLRMNINASSTSGNLATSSESFKLQWSTSTTGTWQNVGSVASSTGPEQSVVFSTSTTGTTWTVPTGTTSILVKAWGGGGGGGEGEDSASGGNGGGGGFASATIAVTAGTNLTIRVGGGGTQGTNDNDAGGGGAGGGYSAVLSPTSTIWIQASGGGGGGGAGGSSGEDGGDGGAGGGLTGTNGSVGSGPGGDFGNGGTQSAGGAGGSGGGGGAGDGAAGSSLTGGGGGNGGSGTGGGAAGGTNGGGAAGCAVCSNASESGGGGGGSGLFGGGGGEAGSGEGAGGGGGGSSGFDPSVSASSTTSGSGTAAGNNTDSDYAGNAGLGGTGSVTTATAGTTGLIVIRYSTTTEAISSVWEFHDNTSVASGTTLTSTLQLADSDVGETYEEQNPTAVNPNAIAAGQDGEWDFALDPAGVQQTTYYFRMIRSDGTELDYYENYPAITFGEVAGENAPTVTNVVLNNGDDITLIPNATTSIMVSFTVEDADGCEDVFTSGWVTSTIYRTGVSSTCQATGPTTNNLNCYLVTTTTNSCSGGTSANATSTFGVYYFAQATDASSSYSTESWQAFVQVKDAAGTGSNWWNSSWLNRKKITLAPSSTATLTDFPILVQLNSSTNIDHAKTKSAGEDIRFIDADDSTELSYEIEQWNENATSTFWVKVPSVATGTADYIYMYYNNSGATTSTQNSSSVWSASYDVVWHMTGSGTTIRDSTGDDNPSLPTGWSWDSTGRFGPGLNWASSTTNGNEVTTGFNEGQDWSLDLWFRRTDSPASNGFDDAYVFHGNVWDGVVAYHLADPPTKLDEIGYSSAHSGMFTTDFGDGVEDHLVLTSDWDAPAGGQVKFTLYKNGAYVASSTQTQGATQGSLFLGGDIPYQLGADIDEFRLSATVRDGNWVTASYRSMTGQMNTFGAEESPSSAFATSTFEELNTLVALHVLTSSINYGTIFPSSTTGATNQITNIANAGNASATLRLSALQTLLFGTNVIPTSSQRYATSTFTFPGLAVQLTDVATAVTSFFLTAPTSTANVTSSVYWGLEVPIGMPTGTYSGTNLFTGVWAP
jgi:hypothetical protein